MLLLVHSLNSLFHPVFGANRGVYRSLEGAGDLSNSFLYQYPTVQLENYHKDYRSVQKRLSRRMEKRDALNRAGGSASRWVGRNTLFVHLGILRSTFSSRFPLSFIFAASSTLC